MRKYPILLTAIAAVFLIIFCFTASLYPDSISDVGNNGGENPLDGCTFVYLDMGTNIGVQIRKLYEQDLFPGAPIIPLFEKYFGKFEERDFSEVCSVGWEPNPGHASYLAELESHYRDCGYRLTINTLTGVGVNNKQGQFARLKQDPMLLNKWPMELPSRFVSEDQLQKQHIDEISEISDVTVVRIADYINQVVATRQIPPGRGPGAVVMKLDVEGLEVEIVSDLIMSGAIAHLDNIHVDWETMKLNMADYDDSAKDDVELLYNVEVKNFM